MPSAQENKAADDFDQLRELAGEHAEDDRVIALMMRLATLGVDLSAGRSGC